MLLSKVHRNLTLRAVAAFAAFAWCALAVAASTQSSFASLDALVGQQQYRAALLELDRNAAEASEKLEWLRRHAEEGHVPIVYELSVRLFSTDVSESLKWYARGRLARTLDASECAQPTASFGWRVILDRQAKVVVDAGVANARDFSKAIDEALEWDSRRTERPSAAWICGSVDQDKDTLLLPQPKRDAERADTRETMALKATAVADFYRAADAGAVAKFPRLASQIVVPNGVMRTSAGWLDNRRLLFAGRQLSGSEEAGDVIFPNLYVWDTDQDRISLIRTEGAIWDMCVDGGKVKFVYAKPGSRDGNWLASGRFPELGDRFVTPDESRRLFRRSDCERTPDDPRVPGGSFRTWLRSGDGYLSGNQDGITLHRPDGVAVRLEVGYQSWPYKGYAPFAGAYLLLGGARDRKTGELKWSSRAKPGEVIVLFWLQPSGKAEPVEVPYGVWNESTGDRYTPTRVGILLAGGAWQGEQAPGFSGLYLFETTGITRRLDLGPSQVSAVSPDGCRVAYANAPNLWTAARAMTMKIIDLCRKS